MGHSLSSGEFLRCLPLAPLDSPAPEQSFMELVANPGFNAWNFVLALIGETSFELFFRITETLVDSERKILMEEKYPIPETSDIQPEPPVRRLRLIVSSSSSDEEKEVKKKARSYSYRANRLTSSEKSEGSELFAVGLNVMSFGKDMIVPRLHGSLREM